MTNLLRTILIFSLLPCVLAGLALGDSITLRRSVRMTTPGDIIRLGDIAIFDGEYAESLAEIEIGTFKADSTSPVELHLAEVRHVLEEEGVHWGRLELNGQTSIVRSRGSEGVNPPLAMQAINLKTGTLPRIAPRHALEEILASDLVDTHTFRGWLAHSIINTLGVDATDLRLGFPRAQAALLDQPLSTGRYEIRPLNVANHSERLDYEVRLWIDGQPMNQNLISVEPMIRTTVTRLKTDVPRGRPILPSQVEEVEKWLTPLQRTGRVKAGLIDGRAAAVRLRTGTILRNRDLQKSIVVKRGEEIRISCLVGGAVLTLRAVAEKDGSVGESIRFRKGRERESFTARITSRGEAVLDLSNATPTSITDAGSGVRP